MPLSLIIQALAYHTAGKVAVTVMFVVMLQP